VHALLQMVDGDFYEPFPLAWNISRSKHVICYSYL